jgi:hypothetical protein
MKMRNCRLMPKHLVHESAFLRVLRECDTLDTTQINYFKCSERNVTRLAPAFRRWHSKLTTPTSAFIDRELRVRFERREKSLSMQTINYHP